MQGNDLRKGDVVRLENKLWVCLSVEHRTPGNLRAFIQAKLRSIADGNQKEFRFSSTEKLEPVDIFEKRVQYLYNDGAIYYFMDTDNYEQIELSNEMIADKAIYLAPEMNLSVSFCEGNPIEIKLPTTLDFEIVECDPEIKGATASAQYKNAKLDNGLDILVPQFIKIGDKVRINVEKGSYQERVKK